MLWFKQFFWRFFVVFVLIPLIYGAFGWYVAEMSKFWSEWLIFEGAKFGFTWKSERTVTIIDGIAAVLVVLLPLALTLLVKQMTFIFGSWFRSDLRAIFSVLGWSFAVVVVFRWIHHFARLIILLSVTILGLLELQESGYNRWQIFAVLIFIGLSSYILGVLAYSFGHSSIREETGSICCFLVG